LHHALMNHVSPVLDRSMIDDTFACRTGKGSLAAVTRCQHHIRRFDCFSKQDVRQYFASIPHEILLEMLHRRFRSEGVCLLLRRIVESHSDAPGRGLPIGALTSQHFANFYLGLLDRFLLEHSRVRAMVRYMDDFVFWCPDLAETKSAVAAVREFSEETLQLSLRDSGEINSSRQGVTLCGYRIYRGTIRLSASRRKRFRQTKAKWEELWLSGKITAKQLQNGYSAALAITLHADSLQWRRQGLAANAPAWYECV
ncbi:MAG: RNA-directed DNA polymerase, partial [Planctomycetota bacterium]